MATYECYMSFCEEDADLHDVEVLLSELKAILPDDVRIHYYREERYGLEFEAYISLLRRVQCSIVLLTPGYKRRVDIERRRDSGVYKEYEMISERREPSSKGLSAELALIPVLWKGRSIEDSMPQYFLGSRFAANLQQFHAQRVDGKYVLPAQFRPAVSDTLQKIASDILSHKAQIEAELSPAGRALSKSLVEDANLKTAFISRESPTKPGSDLEKQFQIKYERMVYDTATFRKKFFVQTSFYRSVKRHEHYIFSGRKGSGKTTLAQILIHDSITGNSDDGRVAAGMQAIDVQVNDWNMHDLFDEIIVGQISGDFDFLRGNVEIFRFAWTSFIIFCLVRGLVEGGLIGPHELADVFPDARVHQEFLASQARYRDLFRLSLVSIKWFFDKLIEKAPRRSEDQFRAYLRRRANIGPYAAFLCGADFKALRDQLGRVGNSRPLFCLDRFDTAIQGFRKLALKKIRLEGDFKAEVYLQREVNWLHGLVAVVAEAKARDRLTPDSEVYDLFRQLDFFVVIPKDRLLEVQADMRDAVAVDEGLDVRWKPYELLTMLRKRLQVAAHFDDDQLDRTAHRGPRARYEYVVKRLFPELPRDIVIKIGPADFKIDLFLGVLRHTFWRPRDIMIHYLPILQRMYSYKARGSKQFDQAVVRNIISQKNRELVSTEFLQEFSDTIVNLPDVLREFKGSSQTHDMKSLDKLLSRLELRLATTGTVTSTIDKMRMLYEIGFMGLKPGRQFGSLSPTGDFTFVFMHRTEVVDFEATSMIEGSTVAIHPAFIEPLSLIPGATPGGGGVPVLNLTWDMIDQNDGSEV